MADTGLGRHRGELRRSRRSRRRIRRSAGFDGERLEYEADGINFSGLLFLPVGPVDLFARAGFISWGTKARLPDIEGASDSDDGMDFSYGAGAQFRVWSLSLRAEYEVFDVSPDKVDMISLGIMWTFL